MRRARIGTLVAASSAIASLLIFACGKDPAPSSVISIVSVDAAGNATSLGVAPAHLTAGDAADVAPARALDAALDAGARAARAVGPSALTPAQMARLEAQAAQIQMAMLDAMAHSGIPPVDLSP